MDVATLNEAANALSKGGLILVMLVILVSGYKQKWVWGHQLSDMTADRNHWRDMYNELTRGLATEQRQIDAEQRILVAEILRDFRKRSSIHTSSEGRS